MPDKRPPHVSDTHRHPLGTTLAAKMAEQGLYDSSESPDEVAVALKKARSEVARSADK